MLDRDDVMRIILDAKAEKGLTWREIAEAVGRHPVWVTAALLGQAAMSPAEADAACKILGVDPVLGAVLEECPMRGSLSSAIPTDPLIYRFYEVMQVYGTTIKALVHEEFGDGIMSAIDFELDVAREPDPAGDRVVITMSGKFLPYRKW